VYEKEKALQQPTARESVRLKRVGEAVYEGGQWSVNNEQVSTRTTLQLWRLQHLIFPPVPLTTLPFYHSPPGGSF
jgi:hypothetical protein